MVFFPLSMEKNWGLSHQNQVESMALLIKVPPKRSKMSTNCPWRNSTRCSDQWKTWSRKDRSGKKEIAKFNAIWGANSPIMVHILTCTSILPLQTSVDQHGAQSSIYPPHIVEKGRCQKEKKKKNGATEKNAGGKIGHKYPYPRIRPSSPIFDLRASIWISFHRLTRQTIP